MSTDIVIRAEHVGKRYLIEHQLARERYNSLRDTIARGAGSLLGRVRGNSAGVGRRTTEEFWALDDISFEIARGEVVGIIGRNGAGKSTLLKVLSRITEPTRGRITLKGRLASLLEVGTGFHPELTGRENIYLNGAILGMSRAEVRAKFEEIVAFAEVEQFLDTPVKRYSSGMYVRLAFAVAAHLEPEILIVDEVLAVGDAEFQKKCLGKMQDVAGHGRTVLFVSHSMAAVQNLCRTGLMLVRGRVVARGPIDDVVRRYLAGAQNLAQIALADRRDREGNGVLRFATLSFCNGAGEPVTSLTSGEPARIDILLSKSARQAFRSVRIALGMDNDAGQRILVCSTHLAGADITVLPADVDVVSLHVPRLTLTAGRYGLTLYCTVNSEIADWVKNAGSFDVEGGDFYGSGQMPGAGQGSMLMDHRFELRQITAPALADVRA